MELTYKLQNRTLFINIGFGECFSVVRGMTLMRIRPCFISDERNPMNSIDLANGELHFICPDDEVIPLKVTAYVTEEVIE